MTTNFESNATKPKSGFDKFLLAHCWKLIVALEVIPARVVTVVRPSFNAEFIALGIVRFAFVPILNTKGIQNGNPSGKKHR